MRPLQSGRPPPEPATRPRRACQGPDWSVQQVEPFARNPCAKAIGNPPPYDTVKTGPDMLVPFSRPLRPRQRHQQRPRATPSPDPLDAVVPAGRRTPWRDIPGLGSVPGSPPSSRRGNPGRGCCARGRPPWDGSGRPGPGALAGAPTGALAGAPTGAHNAPLLASERWNLNFRRPTSRVKIARCFEGLRRAKISARAPPALPWSRPEARGGELDP